MCSLTPINCYGVKLKIRSHADAMSAWLSASIMAKYFWWPRGIKRLDMRLSIKNPILTRMHEADQNE